MFANHRMTAPPRVVNRHQIAILPGEKKALRVQRLVWYRTAYSQTSVAGVVISAAAPATVGAV